MRYVRPKATSSLLLQQILSSVQCLGSSIRCELQMIPVTGGHSPTLRLWRSNLSRDYKGSKGNFCSLRHTSTSRPFVRARCFGDLPSCASCHTRFAWSQVLGVAAGSKNALCFTMSMGGKHLLDARDTGRHDVKACTHYKTKCLCTRCPVMH